MHNDKMFGESAYLFAINYCIIE